MGTNTVMLITACVLLLTALLHVFFGYKLARFLLPICAVALIETVLYLFVYPNLGLNDLGTWLFFCGCGAAVYTIMFFLPRIAAFFTGLCGGTLFAVFAVYAFALHGFPLLYPIALALCALFALMAAVYKRVGVAVFTALFGGCASAYIGLYLYFGGVNALGSLLTGNALLPLELFLSQNALLVGGAALVLTAAGIIVQLGITAKTQVLAGRLADRSYSNRRNNVADTL